MELRTLFPIDLAHLLRLQTYCKTKLCILVIRCPKFESLAYIRQHGYVSKPYEVKLKTDTVTGLVRAPDFRAPPYNAPEGEKHQVPPRWKPDHWGNWCDIRQRGYQFDSAGNLRNPQKKLIFSDYDIMGKYVWNDLMKQYKYDDSINTRNGLGELNHMVAGHGQRMFNHAGQDAWIKWFDLDNKRPIPFRDEVRVGKGSDVYLAVDEKGRYFEFYGAVRLKDFYAGHEIRWIYS